MTLNKTADLKFAPGASTGFSAAGIAAFDDLRPAAVVRELLQNSLDAARSAGIPKSSICFRLDQVSVDQIPGIGAYKKAFNAAVARQRNPKNNELPGQAKLIVDRIEDALKQPSLDILSIVDNGVGLDERRMDALLSDGVSVKDNQATGTYGNGHFTTVPASDLRYILYGGVTKDGARIAAGHAILASHFIQGKKHLTGADGFFIRGFNAGNNSLYDYVIGENMPQLIGRDLDFIRSRATHRHGTTVIITAFNHFLENHYSLWNEVARAASANFFEAIKEGKLEITVEDIRSDHGSGIQTLDHSTLPNILKEHQTQKRTGAFLSGARAFDAYHVLCSGQRDTIKTKIGEIVIHLQKKSAESTRINLCRNGMWITDDRRSDGIPGFRYKFTDRVPFHAVLSLNGERGGDLHELIRNAEGPLHDSIRLKRLHKVDRTRCQAALNEVRTWILNHTSSISSDPYTPDDFLALHFGDNDEMADGNSRRANWGTPVPINRRPVHQPSLFPWNSEETEPGQSGHGHQGKGNSSNATNRSRNRPSLPVIFQAASRPTGEHRRRIVIDCFRDYTDAEMRLIVDEAIDATCDRPNKDPYTPATLSNVNINGTQAAEEDLLSLDNRTVGIYLGNLVKGTTIEIETDYHLSGDFAGLADPVLRIELFKSELEKQPAKN